MKQTKIFALTCFAILFLSNCNRSGKVKEQNKESENKTLKSAKDFDRKFNDYARYMAGMPLNPGSGLEQDDSNAYFQLHIKDFDARWKEMDAKRLSKMRDWAKSELHPKIDAQLNLYYPFSGADFLHANQFFPDARKNLYIALEPCGEVPDLKSKTPAQRIQLLKSIDVALADIFKRSYFITDYMNKNVKAIGHTPLFMVFMARCGYDVLNVELIELAADATCKPRSAEVSGINGVRFTYCPTGKPEDIRTLEYFSADVSDANCTKYPQIENYVTKFGKANTYFKAASYIMHWNTFVKFRNASLNISTNVLQDDTGFPYSVLKDKYNPFFYGVYVPAIKDFKGYFQPELSAIFNNKNAYKKELPFSLGYHWFDKQQNLMLFVQNKEK